MPEIPEVETIRRGLDGFILKKKITKITILCEKSLRGDINNAINQQIEAVGRKGKALLIRFSNDYSLMIHLRMTGQLIFIGNERFEAGHPDDGFFEEMPGRHTRVYFEFDDGSHLYFNDQRKFGFVAILNQQALAKDKFLLNLGPEPWDMAKDEFLRR